jgi:hypothetical protein
MHILHRTKASETLADIAYAAGKAGYYSGDSREDIQQFIWWAIEFEKKYSKVKWDNGKLDYIEEIEKYIQGKLEEEKQNVIPKKG